MEHTGTAAIVFLAREGAEPALMLEPLLFDPAARWLAESLVRAGVERFMVVCHDDDFDAAGACFPGNTGIVTTSATDAPRRLRDFLEGCGGKVAVFTKPVLLSDEAARVLVHERAGAGPLGKQETGVYRLDAKELSAALEGGEELEDALKGHGEPMGGTSVWYQGGYSLWPGWESRAGAEMTARQYTATRLMMAGVRVLDPGSLYAGPQVTVGRGSVLLPGTILRGKTAIGEDCEIGPDTMIRDCAIGKGVTVNSSQLHEAEVEDGASVGPFAYLRPNTHVGPGVKVGDFVELKNSTVGQGTKIAHLAYVGDADVGEQVSLGCGTVTVNYDGAKKYRTRIGDSAFVGCNVNLVAPVEVGKGSYVAAGSTITADVPADSLAIARSEQTIKSQWTRKKRGKQ